MEYSKLVVRHIKYQDGKSAHKSKVHCPTKNYVSENVQIKDVYDFYYPLCLLLSFLICNFESS